MHNSAPMHEMDGAGECLRQLGRLTRGHRRTALPLGETAAGQVFKHQIVPALGLTHFLERHDSSMIQAGYEFSLAAESLDIRWRCLLTGEQHLQSYQAIEARFPGLVHGGAATPAQLAPDLVVRNLRQSSAVARRAVEATA